MGEDEEETLRTLSSHRKLIDSLIEQHHGRFVNSAGDSVLAEFASVVNAVQCAVEIQTTLKAENVNLPPERRMEFRIGVNLGDVMVDGKHIYGDGVNFAARLESLAEPGSIFISGSVHEQLGNKLASATKTSASKRSRTSRNPCEYSKCSREAAARRRQPDGHKESRENMCGEASSRLPGLRLSSQRSSSCSISPCSRRLRPRPYPLRRLPRLPCPTNHPSPCCPSPA